MHGPALMKSKPHPALGLSTTDSKKTTGQLSPQHLEKAIQIQVSGDTWNNPNSPSLTQTQRSGAPRGRGSLVPCSAAAHGDRLALPCFLVRLALLESRSQHESIWPAGRCVLSRMRSWQSQPDGELRSRALGLATWLCRTIRGQTSSSSPRTWSCEGAGREHQTEEQRQLR